MSMSRQKRQLVQTLQGMVNDGPAGPNLRRWCDKMVGQRKSWLVVSLTQIVVRSISFGYVLEELIRNDLTDYLPNTASLDEREWLYRHPRQMIQRAYDQFFTIPPEWLELFGFDAGGERVGAGTAMRVQQILLREMSREAKNIDPEELRREIKEYFATPEAVEHLHAVERQKCATYNSLLDDSVNPGWDEAMVDAALALPAVQFFLTVWLRCWFLYGESASQLLERAESGDLAALENLLRLDKRTMFFPRIGRRVDDCLRNRMPGAFMLTEAFRDLPKPRMKLERLKVSMSAFILHMSDSISALGKCFGPPLTRLDAFEAFTAAALDQGQKCDRLLPTEDAYCRALSRPVHKKYRTAAAWDIFSA